jgi:hypothetical protein
MVSEAVFIPRGDLSRRENLVGFIQSARDELQVFGVDLKFDENVWDVTDYLDLKARGNKRTRINFFVFSENSGSQVPLPEPFLSFAKAYIRYMHGLRPKKFIAGRLYALKAVAQALETEVGTAEVERINGHVMDTSAAVIKKRYDESLAYRIGGDLERLSGFLSDNGFTAVPVRWRNALRRPSDTQRIGKEFDERRVEKMPSEAALEALPQAFHDAVEPGDVVVVCVVAILLSAPSRISEVLLLPTNCEVTRQTANDTRVLLRWWPSKGAPPMVKPVYSGMSDVVANAITKLKEISIPAREIAKWYEDHPTQLFLPRGTEHLRDSSYLTIEEVAQIIGVEDGRSWCKVQRIEVCSHAGRPSVRFADVERCIVALLPQGFPIVNKETGLRYSDSLVLVRKNELHRSRATYLCTIEPVATDFVNDALGGKRDGRASMLDRMGFREPNGDRIEITTHQFRHYLNTIAQMGGLSQLDIAKWSGRVDVRQNAAYDHVSSGEMLTIIRKAVGDSSLMFGPLGTAPDRRLISRDEFAQLKVPTAHVTELGFCIHDFTMAPCEIHRDCINCEELVCVKCSRAKTAQVKHQLDESRLLLERAEAAQKEGEYGADRWVVHQRATVERLEQLYSILDDPSVPTGTLITLARPNAPGRLRLSGNKELTGAAKQLQLIAGKTE